MENNLHTLEEKRANQRERPRRYRARHKTKINARNRARYRTDPEKHKEYGRKYRATNLEKARTAGREKMRRYRAEHPEEAAEYYRSYRAANLDHERERNRAWNAAHPERRQQANRQYRERNGDRHRQEVQKWQKANSWKCRLYRANRAARIQQASPAWLTDTHISEIREIYRKASELKLTVDHIIPLKNKHVCGLHVPWNLRLLSSKENCSKGNRLLADL